MNRTVAFVNDTAQLGGAEFVLLQIVAQMQASDWRPQVVLPETGPLAVTLRERGVPVYIVPHARLLSTSWYWRQQRKLPNPLALAYNLLPLLLWLWRLKTCLASLQPDFIHTNGMWSHAAAGAAGCLVGRPVVWHVHDIVDAAAGWGLYRPLFLGWARLWPRLILCVSEAVADQFRSDARLFTKVRVLWNTVDLDRFRPAPAREYPCPRPLTIGTVARLTPWKGHELALQVARHLKNRGLPFHWHFAGTEALGARGYQAHLLALAHAWGLERHLTWHGWVDDMAAFYRSLDVLVHLPTEADPCPLVLTEALASGLLIVASSGGAADRHIPAAGGCLVPPNQPGAAAECLAEAYQSPLETGRRRAQARRYAEATFSLPAYANHLLQIYAALETTHGKPALSPTPVGDRPGR